MNLFIICFLILTHVSCNYCWDNDDLEIFDLVEEINTNFYTLLGIPQDANATAIRKAFRSLSLQLHPDKNSAPDAEEKFRQLVSVYDVIKEPTKREKYDEVLKNGLPNWKSAVYYYRHVRKVGLIEMFCILFVLVSIGQYVVGWASYIEQKFNIESMKKPKEKKLRKAAKGKDKAPTETVQQWVDEIPKPSVLNTLPVQIPKLLWTMTINLPTTISCVVRMISEAIEQRKLQKEAELAQMEEEYQPELKEDKPKRRKKIPFVPQERQFEENSCLLDPVEDVSPVIEKYRPAPVAGGFWSDDDLAELARLANKYPPGTPDRWEKIADIMNRCIPEVTHMALKIKDNPHLFLKSSEENNTVVDDSPKKVKTKAESKIEMDENASWSQLQQKAFENALQKYPKGSVSDRWEKISKSVPNKTKEECILRYKYLVELLKKQKNKSGGTEAVDESSEQI